MECLLVIWRVFVSSIDFHCNVTCFLYEARSVDPTDCIIRDGTCSWHQPNRVLQIFSLKLAELTLDLGPVELYGYIAVRDYMDTLLNYVVNISRDDPIIVKQVQIHTYPLKYKTRYLAP